MSHVSITTIPTCAGAGAGTVFLMYTFSVV